MPVQAEGAGAVGVGRNMVGNAIGEGSTANYTHIEQQTVITARPEVHPPAGEAASAPLAPPPRVPPEFTGRDEDLENLLTLLSPSLGPDLESTAAVGAPSEQAVVVASVLGMGGMGKTTLALAAGHAALKRDLFTGVLFLDLHGYDDTPTDAAHALDTALRALDTPSEQIPPDTDQRAALYRAQLAARTRAGERILVLADNASSSAQVKHLLPSGGGPHRMLVTSRDNLAPGLGARLVDLDVLSPERAVALMDTVLRITRPTDGRITADPVGARRVAELCGHLPLALRIATAQLGRHLKPAQLARDLENLAERLDVLEGRDGAVRTVLESSYRRLAPTHAELFRLLAVNPGPDMSTETAIALTGIGKPRDVRTRLEVLADASLIRQDPDTGRWRMHDLVRAYATEQARLNPQHSAKALARLFEYYAYTSRAAAVHLDAAAGGDTKRFPDRVAARAWLDAERANLVAAVQSAHATGCREITVDLASLLGDYLRSGRYLQDALVVAALAHEVAPFLGDRHREAMAWSNLGVALAELRRFDEALEAHRHALDICRDLGNRDREGLAWSNLGLALVGLGRFDEALEAHRHALDICRDLRDRHGEGKAWGNLGGTLHMLRRFDEALDALQHALDIHQDLGDRHREAGAWNNLSIAFADLRRFDEALDALQHALDIHQDLGDRHHEAGAWGNLGSTLAALRRFDEALDAYQHALDIHQDLDDRHHEAIAWNSLGLALQDLRRFDDALDAHQHALDIHQDLDDRHSEGIAWNNLGTAWRGTGAYEQAVEAGERAVAVFRELNDAYREGQALGELADTLLAAGHPPGEVRAVREASAAAYRQASADTEAEEALAKADE
ncbi:tetratricopeptide repeat protein [Streptomyces sp. NRRL B-24484]|uniref:tetratricopeptide repeat protein n=1 Tax=Streptomyces sp. NRRL B-24484 TaxID=1463833 RepID=UPI001331C322|nr:tetratricopeptide repeat protein [Streptomyces sp. NRRL B-24484]